MDILVINAGSSSIKYQLINSDDESLKAKGLCEQIGLDGSNIKHVVTNGPVVQKNLPFKTHAEAFSAMLDIMTTGEGKVIENLSDIGAVGHRVLYGTETWFDSQPINDETLAFIESLKELGPLHIPPQVAAIRASQEVFGMETPMVAVFDTSFHLTMPPKAYIYPIPYEYYERYKIRRYGFHGTSHKYVSLKYFEQSKKPAEGSKIITVHLGNGSSITAIKDGKSFDTTMGFTPLDGFMMGTRSGSIDPAIVTFIANKENKTPDEINDILNKKSGFLGVSGVSSDSRVMRQAAQDGNERAKLTVEILNHQLKKYIGSYIAAMGGVDAIIFTGGIGENVGDLRFDVMSDMEFAGIKIDKQLNQKANSVGGIFSTADSKVEVMVIPTNEEIMIARDTYEVVQKNS